MLANDEPSAQGERGAVPALSLSFSDSLSPPPIDQMQLPANEDPRTSPHSGGRRASREHKHQYSPYATSPRRLSSPHSPRSPATPGPSPLSAASSGQQQQQPQPPPPPPQPVAPGQGAAAMSPTSPRLDVPGEGPIRTRHRRTHSDSRTAMNAQLLLEIAKVQRQQQMNEAEMEEIAFQQSQGGFVPPRNPRPVPNAAPPADLPDDLPPGIDLLGVGGRPRHRRSHSDSSSMKLVPSPEGYRLVIPAETLQSLKGIDAKDHEAVTVLLAANLNAQDPNGLLFRNPNANGGGNPNANAPEHLGDGVKLSARPKHYKCGKCGLPKKGHVCEYAKESKPARAPKGASPATPFALPNGHVVMMQPLGVVSGVSPHSSSPRLDLNYSSSPKSPSLHAYPSYVPTPIDQARAQLAQSAMLQSFPSGPDALSLHMMSQGMPQPAAPQDAQLPPQHPAHDQLFQLAQQQQQQLNAMAANGQEMDPLGDDDGEQQQDEGQGQQEMRQHQQDQQHHQHQQQYQQQQQDLGQEFGAGMDLGMFGEFGEGEQPGLGSMNEFAKQEEDDLFGVPGGKLLDDLPLDVLGNPDDADNNPDLAFYLKAEPMDDC